MRADRWDSAHRSKRPTGCVFGPLLLLASVAAGCGKTTTSESSASGGSGDGSGVGDDDVGDGDDECSGWMGYPDADGDGLGTDEPRTEPAHACFVVVRNDGPTTFSGRVELRVDSDFDQDIDAATALTSSQEVRLIEFEPGEETDPILMGSFSGYWSRESASSASLEFGSAIVDCFLR